MAAPNAAAPVEAEQAVAPDDVIALEGVLHVGQRLPEEQGRRDVHLRQRPRRPEPMGESRHAQRYDVGEKLSLARRGYYRCRTHDYVLTYLMLGT